MLMRSVANAPITPPVLTHLCGQGEQLLDVAILVAAVLGEELEAVAVVGQVRGRDHHCAVVLIPCAADTDGPSDPAFHDCLAFFVCQKKLSARTSCAA